MNTEDRVPAGLPIVALDDDGDFIAKAHHLGIGHGQTEITREQEAYMLVLRMSVEMSGWRFEDVRRWNAPGWYSPLAPLQSKAVLGWAPARLNCPVSRGSRHAA